MKQVRGYKIEVLLFDIKKVKIKRFNLKLPLSHLPAEIVRLNFDLDISPISDSEAQRLMDHFENISNSRGGIVEGVFGKATLNEMAKD